VIAGATRGAGGPALGRHLAQAGGNDAVLELDGRGLVAVGIRAQVAELTRLGAHARTRTPLYHVHADPPADRPWNPAEREDYWTRFEAEFGLQDRPFAAVAHVKDGRAHEHRVYLRVRPDGTAVRLDHDHARREKLGRVFEFDRGESLVAGAHGRAVAVALEREGRADVAAAMRASGVLDGPRPRARLTPDERHQQDRTGVGKDAVREAALAAWRASDGGVAFQAALAERGLRLARGDTVPQLVDVTGGTHDLRRVLSAAAKAAGSDPIRAGDVRDRLAGLALRSVEDARRTVADALPTLPAEMPPDVVPVIPPPIPQGAPEHAASDPTHRGEQHGQAFGHPEKPSGTVLATVSAPAASLDGQQRRGPDGGDDAGPDDTGDPSVQGQPRDGSGELRGAEDSEADCRPVAALGPAAATRAGRADSDPEGGRVAGNDGDGDRADRAASGRARITARRAERELAVAAALRGDRFAALTAALRHPPTSLSLAQDALAASDRRTEAVLAAEPWRDPRTRDVRRVADDLHDQASDRQRLRQEAAQQARQACETMRSGIGFLDRLASRLGIRTAAVRDFQSAETAAIRAEVDRDEGRGGLRDEYRHARDVAPAIVRGRLAERDDWERRPHVLAARRQARGDDLVREAIAAGEPRVMLLAGHDLGLARDELLRDVAERSWRAEACLRHEEALRQQEPTEGQAARSPSTEALQPEGWPVAGRR